MKKTLPAFLAALLITVILGIGMAVVGQNTLTASTTQAATETTTILKTDHVIQLEQVLDEYQIREAEYQTELNTAIERLTTANQQLSQAKEQIQEYESLLVQLQDSGLITITSDGTITVNQTFFTQPDDHAGRGERPERIH